MLEESRRATEAKALREKEAARLRGQHLESMAGRIDSEWSKVETLATAKKRETYAEAVEILLDLREIAETRRTVSEFERRIADFRNRHAKKGVLICLLAARMESEK